MEDSKLVLVHVQNGHPLEATTVGMKHGKRSGWKLLTKKAKSIVQGPTWQDGDSIELFMVMEEGKMSPARMLDQDEVRKWAKKKE
ncbi:MAG: hypothetical protein GTO63_34335 [Anaerolineae bacterium]|nr:hypothetical protein [Anaerolineae bacterium]NIN99719.1 hypothetical protein [Anaerolineae bacterium]NIQ82571.1 hypothetical protein [Anaerolineae bacterium]